LNTAKATKLLQQQQKLTPQLHRNRAAQQQPRVEASTARELGSATATKDVATVTKRNTSTVTELSRTAATKMSQEQPTETIQLQ
jgi:hypothetical protein